MEKVERIQYQVALAITGAWQGSSRSRIYEELGWETLFDRRLIKRIRQIHKIMDDKTPSYLKDKLPPHRLPFFVKCRSFFPDAISSWNEIITHFEHLPSREDLKKDIQSSFRPISKCA